MENSLYLLAKEFTLTREAYDRGVRAYDTATDAFVAELKARGLHPIDYQPYSLTILAKIILATSNDYHDPSS